MRELYIERLGQRGEGIAPTAEGPVYVAYALPGETVLAEIAGERGRLLRVVTPSPDRIAAVCAYYGRCGGCAVQTLAPEAYAAWKQGLLVAALRAAGVAAPVGRLIDAHGAGRRRATFHARTDAAGETMLGFMAARAHQVVDITACPILAPPLQRALPATHAIAALLGKTSKPRDIAVTATLSGLDIDIRGHGDLSPEMTQSLVGLAHAHDLARISNHGHRVIERRSPRLRIGRAVVAPPPRAFLQATEAGEAALAEAVGAALAGAARVADLFAGLGTFSLRLAEQMQVHAVDSAAPALAALAKAASATAALKPLTTETRDLFRRPLAAAELAPFDAVVFDPPRAGAEAQAQALAAASVPLVAAVSCNVRSFARDAAILVAGGYRLDGVTPIDQFRYSAHLEIVGIFRRAARPKRPRRLLG